MQGITEELFFFWIMLGFMFVFIRIVLSANALLCLSAGAMAAASCVLCGAGVKIQFVIFAAVTFAGVLMLLLAKLTALYRRKFSHKNIKQDKGGVSDG